MDNLPHLIKPEDAVDLKPEEAAQVRHHLSNPLVVRYIRQLRINALIDFHANEAETREQEQQLAARFNKYKGVDYICTFLVNNFEVVRKEGKKDETKKV